MDIPIYLSIDLLMDILVVSNLGDFTNKIVKNIFSFVYKYFFGYVFISPGKIPKSEIIGSYGGEYLTF